MGNVLELAHVFVIFSKLTIFQQTNVTFLILDQMQHGLQENIS